MKQFKNILLVAPIEKQLLDNAISLITNAQSKLTLMSIVPELDVPTVTTSDGKDVDLQTLMKQELQTELDQTATQLKERDIRVKTLVASGQHLFLEVIKQVHTKKHDLVMMAADGVNSVREQLFGTQSMHLMRKCPCAVWVVKPSRRKKFRNVFAAVDPDPENPTRDGLNAKVIKRAATIAQNHSAKLHVIHVWKALGGEASRNRRWMSKQEIRLYVEKVAETHRSRLDQLLKKHSDGSEIVHMLQGRAGNIIPETVSDLQADLLVMGTVCRTGIPGFFIGNTAESILNQVDCSVLTIKPEGFESPVKA